MSPLHHHGITPLSAGQGHKRSHFTNITQLIFYSTWKQTLDPPIWRAVSLFAFPAPLAPLARLAQTEDSSTTTLLLKQTTMSLEDIKSDIKAIVEEKGCGPILIRLSWHDAGVFSTGKLTGGKIWIFSRLATS